MISSLSSKIPINEIVLGDEEPVSKILSPMLLPDILVKLSRPRLFNRHVIFLQPLSHDSTETAVIPLLGKKI